MLNPEFWQLYFSLQSADSEIPASPNDNTSAHYVLHDGLHSRSAISEHWAEGPSQTQIDNALVGIVQSNRISISLTYFAVRSTKQTTRPRAINTMPLRHS